MMPLIIAAFWILILNLPARADTYLRQPEVDIVHYDISIELTDESDSISATARIHVRMRAAGVSGMRIDFGRMTIDALQVQGIRRRFRSGDDYLSFDFGRKFARDEIAIVEVRYHGKPEKGLLIGRNRYGQRVFFTENWPDRAHYWLPSMDHPSDKATVQMTVTAPQKYDVVSNGSLVRTEIQGDGRKLTQWIERKAIPTYCIALGVAEFSIARQMGTGAIPIEWYSFPQDSEYAARKFSPSAAALAYFSSMIAPYPYEKLAQVQATVAFEGMENSSAIFYSESSVREESASVDPVPHEIAHQWFGNSVTPDDWDHLWLSEGFATYFEALFYEYLHGKESLTRRMSEYAKKLEEDILARLAPIIDPGQPDPMKKLNSLNYEKGAWVLHMLRGMLGDVAFFDGIRQYYRSHQGGNATSDDFRKAMESASGTTLNTFFNQWLYQAGWPEYRILWRWNETDHEVELSVCQAQDTGLFDTVLEILFEVGDRREYRKFRISEKTHLFRIPMNHEPMSIRVDPDGWLLKTASVEQN
ncbi:MAG: M1 family metallopeptidase [Acidobacteria bacterium]|nr:M1 family metallopeptidase [Acidobacteriota bacterium]